MENGKQKRYQIEGPDSWGIMEYADSYEAARVIIRQWLDEDEGTTDENSYRIIGPDGQYVEE